MKKRKFNLFKELFPKFPTLFLYLFIGYKLKNCKTILDLGCGSYSPIRFINAKTYGIDASSTAIKNARRNRTHDILKAMDVRKISKKFKPQSFDAVVAIDLIEHLSKKDGVELIKKMEDIAGRKVLIFTPNGFIKQHGDLKYDEHLSGWTTKDFKKLGYRVYGMFGPRFLRGDKHEITYKPLIIGALLSEIMQWTYLVFKPSKAAAILGLKEIDYD